MNSKRLLEETEKQKRVPGIIFVDGAAIRWPFSTQEANRHAFTDEAQLLSSAGAGRFLVSKNDNDYRALTLDYQLHGLPPYMFDYLHPAPGEGS